MSTWTQSTLTAIKILKYVFFSVCLGSPLSMRLAIRHPSMLGKFYFWFFLITQIPELTSWPTLTQLCWLSWLRLLKGYYPIKRSWTTVRSALMWRFSWPCLCVCILTGIYKNSTVERVIMPEWVESCDKLTHLSLPKICAWSAIPETMWRFWNYRYQIVSVNLTGGNLFWIFRWREHWIYCILWKHRVVDWEKIITRKPFMLVKIILYKSCA